MSPTHHTHVSCTYCTHATRTRPTHVLPSFPTHVSRTYPSHVTNMLTQRLPTLHTWHAPPQAVWALGNIAGDSPKCRDLVLNTNALQPLLEQLKEQVKISMVRNATWTLSNFCRGKPQPDFQVVRAGVVLACPYNFFVFMFGVRHSALLTLSAGFLRHDLQ